MSLDTKYRPLRYEDVLGQEATVSVLRCFVDQGLGFRQSYLFAGRHGSGKTTLGRILARSLLCESPVEGGPCDQCPSCRSILELGVSESFVEVDAATNSGKADIQKILTEIGYSTFNGKRRIYLFDEAHQLSTSALDAMLKPLEEATPGSEDRRLVCIFCTTEPEKMRATILSRCAPAFVVNPLAPSVLAERLTQICEAEGIENDPQVLPLIAEITECHVRDAIKAVEGVSMLGPVNRDNVVRYLHLDLNAVYLEVLAALGGSLDDVLSGLTTLLERVSPSTCYEHLARASLFSYKVSLGLAKNPLYWDREALETVGNLHGDQLLDIASMLSIRLGKPTSATLECDLIQLHRVCSGERPPIRSRTTQRFDELSPKVSAKVSMGSRSAERQKSCDLGKVSKLPASEVSPKPTHQSVGGVTLTANGVHVDRRAMKRDADTTRSGSQFSPFALSQSEFCRLLALRVNEISEGKCDRSTRPNNLGRS